ncbi:MAG: tRNA preQ1(34) S-adenosylmethionine ribosyltransferase-isomerase QueA [Treponema sp.]|nr:tRNA preQ1(34) S-adenosylmethionine ribosyltransferase-isomerase QueA [Treponema sp.]
MKLSDFTFELPQELIAQKPSGVRGEDKLMRLDRVTGAVSHFAMADLPDLVEPGTLMIFNNSKVRRSRCYGIKESSGSERGSGAEREFMFLNQTTPAGDTWRTMVKGAKKVKGGNTFRFTDGSVGTIVDAEEDAGTEFRTIQFPFQLQEDWFERNGHIPLPPYIRREDDDTDSERYQTIYAKETGSSACPTAGLHFTEPVLTRLREKGVDLAWLTLHVGLGTFLPVRTENIEDHKMHEEVYTVPYDVAEKINQAKKEGRKILAVGTTSVRTLESASDENGVVRGGTGSTHIFMYPGYKFKVVDQMFTNFHTPESTLLMLVSAFAGREHILSAYQTAVEKRYRFFSYGDAMLIQ